MNLPRADVYPTKKVKLGCATQIFKKSVKINPHINLHSVTFIWKCKKSAIVFIKYYPNILLLRWEIEFWI